MSLLQIGVLLFLFARVVAIEDSAYASAPMQNDNAAGNDSYDSRPDSSRNVQYDSTIEPRLRTIVREELAAQLADLRTANTQVATAIAAEELDEGEYQYRVSSVSQQLDIYESVGSISEDDMHKLQSEIMTLNEADREEALSRLVRALNSGALKGRL